MRLILSRKGFDSAAGGFPSPILPDGRLLSLPIPDKQSPLCYSDLYAPKDLGAYTTMGQLVEDLTKGKIRARHGAHLDPDLLPQTLHREEGWRPVLGQVSAAQTHLFNQGVQAGDLFLFYGWFRRTMWEGSRLEYVRGDPGQHVIWGWMQIGQVETVGRETLGRYPWMAYHPHMAGNRPNNTVYLAATKLDMAGLAASEISGGGAFTQWASALQLTAPDQHRRSTWRLPGWFFHADSSARLSYHTKAKRWQPNGDYVYLDSAKIGQEFVLDGGYYPALTQWIKSLWPANLR